MTKISNDDNIQQWSTAPLSVLESFGEQGDFAREHLLNPALFSLLGNVNGKKILDAGCGQGYLCRLMTSPRAEARGITQSASSA